ncbi:hypothetical protein LYSHEL_22320 [Lysobacter helvus]|uniref:Uncharacterized protein n=2 Tax=Lysobacteraceae TaxID=32033 RepID=A0ABM7Q716_9GAMM|nr:MULTISPECIES: hypothetical protein [Lysobacter]BCT93209.1 hypothetical protein LYSCAS_22330 [Lysobacter caseinilyticus]BCT96361.1 hypothetical protein LYSHEL_22320 [Lysobacter helvus]
MARDDLSLMRGGPVFRVLHAMGLVRPDLETPTLIAIALVVVALGPPAVMAWSAGTLLPGGGAPIPLAGDYLVIGRFLFAVPALVLAASPCDRLLRAALRQVGRGGIVLDEQRAAYDGLLARAGRLRDSWVPELVCAVLAIAPALVGAVALGDLWHLRTWMLATDGTLTPAGAWYHAVSLSIFRFVGLIWLWRYLLWSWLLWRLARIGLRVQPTHPDGAGGLAFFANAQSRFAVMAFACGCIVAGNSLNHVVYQHVTLSSLQYLLGGWIVAATLLLVLPLGSLCGTLLRAKRHALFKYAAIGQRASLEFDLRWKKGTSDGAESLLDSPNPSALADFNAVFDSIRRMRLVPVSRNVLVALALSAALPLLPVVFVAVSFDEVVKRLLSIIV